MATSQSTVQEVSGKQLDSLDISATIKAGQPLILRGAYLDKPLVQAGLVSAQKSMDHLRAFDIKRPLTSFLARPEHKGRFFYNEDATDLDFERTTTLLDDFLDRLIDTNASEAPMAYYAGSTDIKTYFPDMLDADDLMPHNDVFKSAKPLSSIWIGNRTVAATHFDMSNNIAACMVGRRKFTLFPPDQISNLYPGPFFPTPAGQIVSMVNPAKPDFETFPNFAHALEHAQIAVLNPGDVLIYPAMWWHQVEALEAFNILINYWWNETPHFLTNPMDTLLHGLLSLRQRPAHEREAWRSLFDYYLFGDTDVSAAHLDEKARGPLSNLDENAARRLRMMLINKLNR